MSDAPENRVAELNAAYADALKDAYIRKRKQWRPDYSGRLASPDQAWLSCAELLAKHNLDPYAYTQFVFDIFIGAQPDVYENQITSINLAETFVTERPKLIERVKLRVRIQADIVSTRIKHGETLESILGDTMAGISPVFAFAAAWSESKHQLAEGFKDDAMRMILFEPLYLELLGQYLPEGAKNGRA